MWFFMNLSNLTSKRPFIILEEQGRKMWAIRTANGIDQGVHVYLEDDLRDITQGLRSLTTLPTS